MIKRKNLWYVTLFSLILVLGVYYVTIPNELLEKAQELDQNEKVVTNIKEESPLVAMRVNLEEIRKEEKKELESKLTNEKLTSEEKNNVYEELKYLNEVQGKEEQLEKKIKDEYDLDCFIKIDNNNASVVCISSSHDVSKANEIMRLIQKEYKTPINTTVKFQKK